MKTFWSYLRYSNIQVALNLNPFVWGFRFEILRPSVTDPGMFGLIVKLLMLRVSFIFDDGSW